MGKQILKISFLFGLLILLSTQGSVGLEMKSQRQDAQTLNTQNLSESLKVSPEYGKTPLYFIPNEGQVDEKAFFYAKASRYTLWLTKEGLVFDSTIRTKKERKDSRPRDPKKTTNPEDFIYERDVSKFVFLDAKENPKIVPVDMTEHKVSYFIGNDPRKWRSGITTSEAVLYEGLYENVDLRVYGVEKQIEYDWVVKPDGDFGDIRFKYTGVKGTRIDEGGNLVVEQKFGQLCHKKPESYQVISGRRIEVDVEYTKVGDDTYGFNAGEYDPDYDLIIDPLVLVYSTYLGGISADYGEGIAVDSSGSAYIAGYTLSSNFPTINAFQSIHTDPNWSWDAFVTKFSPDGSSLVYSSYLGGGDSDPGPTNMGDDFGLGIAVDSSGSAYITGYTKSYWFPTQSAYQINRLGLIDAFLTKFSADGASLVFSTYLGGTGVDYGSGISVDGDGSAYVTGNTASTDFPIVSAYQENHAGGDRDVFLTKFSANGLSLAYSTYLGGALNDYGKSVAVDSSGSAYVTGYTASANFPTQGAYQGSHAGGTYDAFVTKFSAGGSSLVYSTYMGGSGTGDAGSDNALGIDVDGGGSAYLTGWTRSTSFPTQSAYQGSHNGGDYDAFVTKFSASGASLDYSTYLGGSGGDAGYAIAVDANGAAHVGGITISTDFPVHNAYQTELGGFDDAIVTRLSEAGSSLVYSTYLGGSGGEGAFGIAVDTKGSAYIAGRTNGSDFPTRNAYQESSAGGIDAFVAKIMNIIRVDFNSDGQEDILWRHYAPDGRNRVWFLGDTEGGSQPLALSDPEMELGIIRKSMRNSSKRLLGDPREARMTSKRRGRLMVADPREAVDVKNWKEIPLAVVDDPRKAIATIPEMNPFPIHSGIFDPRFATSAFNPEPSSNSPYSVSEIFVGAGLLGGADILAVSDLNWQIMGTGDFNNDGNTDVLWRYNGTGGRVRVWYMNGTSIISGADIAAVSDLNWQIVGTGDFNNDGQVDILWRYNGTGGQVRVWYMDGINIIAGANVSAVSDLNWKVVGTGDFNNDGHVDILWRYNGVGGRNRVWYMDGISILSGADIMAVSDLTWEIAGTGDYNADGNIDILWRYNGTGGYVYIWYMNNTSWLGTERLTSVPDLAWRIVSR